MEAKFWQERWQQNEIGFHNSNPHPSLVEYGARLAPGKIVVPLCGKSLDLIWLRDQGHQVVGAELSELACRAFFQENKIEHRVSKIGKHLVFSSEGIDIWCGDFFELPHVAWDGCTSVYDRAAMVALPHELRLRYVQTILSQWPVDVRQTMLLITVTYSDPVDGPPFSIADAEVLEGYGAAFKIETLKVHREASLSGRAGRFEQAEVAESIYLLTQKTD